MSKHQQELFQHSQPGSPSGRPHHAHPYGYPPGYSPTFVPQKAGMGKGLVSILLGMSVMLISLSLEMWAPEAFKPSYFFGTRIGQLEARAAEVAAPKKAKADAHIKQVSAVAVADVDYAQECRKQILQAANQAYLACWNNPESSAAVCDFLKQEILEMPCPEIPR